jgi:hypothetical protein
MSRRLSREVMPRTATVMTLLAVCVPVAVAIGVLAYETVPSFNAYLNRLLFAKLETASAEERMSWNAQAFRNFLDTWGLGAGMGSVRASNFIIACLASLGVIGTALYAIFLFLFAQTPISHLTGERHVIVRALRAGCLALLIRAVITKATPDLELLFFAMGGMAVGLAAMTVRDQRPPPA